MSETVDPLTTRKARGAVALGYYEWTALLALLNGHTDVDLETRLRIRRAISRKCRAIEKRFE